MPPAAESSIFWLVRTTALLRAALSQEKKALNIKANTFRLFLFFKRPTCSSRDTRNCTDKIGA